MSFTFDLCPRVNNANKWEDAIENFGDFVTNTIA